MKKEKKIKKIKKIKKMKKRFVDDAASTIRRISGLSIYAGDKSVARCSVRLSSRSKHRIVHKEWSSDKQQVDEDFRSPPTIVPLCIHEKSTNDVQQKEEECPHGNTIHCSIALAHTFREVRDLIAADVEAVEIKVRGAPFLQT